MSDPFQTFVAPYVQTASAPLFAEEGGRVAVREKGRKRLLRRHPQFEALMIRTVEHGLKRDHWRGFVYVMHWESGAEIVPLYIGMARRQGRTHPLSVNIERIRTNWQKFGRWGDGRAYHIGDLSHALFGFESYKDVDPRYVRWIDRLFENPQTLELRRPVRIALISWHDRDIGPRGGHVNVPTLEQQLIALAQVSHGDALLNRDDEPAW